MGYGYYDDLEDGYYDYPEKRHSIFWYIGWLILSLLFLFFVGPVLYVLLM